MVSASLLAELERLISQLASELPATPLRLPSPPFSQRCHSSSQALAELSASLNHLQQSLACNIAVTDLQYAVQRVEQMYAILSACRPANAPTSPRRR